jgi:N-acetylglucosamine kinase-like BadF-type ATPase
MSTPVLLAVDGGNSKTDVALVGRDGSVFAAVRGPGSSPHFLGLEGSTQLLERLVSLACEEAGIDRDSGPVATIGAWFMAGADLPAEERALQRAVERLGFAQQNRVANDTFAILRAGADVGWGVAVVVGAGVNAVGLSPNGRTARFLALGDITGDWGGGPDLGLGALGAAVRAEDGRGPATTLGAAVAAHFGKRRPTEVSVAIHQGQIDRDRLLELSPLVFRAAAEGDLAAREILDRQATEVVALARAALQRLRLTRLDATIVLGGGILAAFPAEMVAGIEGRLKDTAPLARCVVCRERPVVGAALAALDLAGANGASTRRLRRSLHDDRIREVSP